MMERNQAGRRWRLTPDNTMLTQLAELGSVMCPLEDVAEVLDVTETALRVMLRDHRAARRAYNGGRAKARLALRQAQFDLARSNASIAMFLGKAHLGQGEPEEGDASDFHPTRLTTGELRTLNGLLTKGGVEPLSLGPGAAKRARPKAPAKRRAPPL